MEIVKYIALLHIIITEAERLHEFSSNDCGSLNANGGAQLKNSRIYNSVTASAKQTWDLFVNFSTVHLVLCHGKRKLLEMCSNSKSSLHCVNHVNSVLHIGT
jgi:hypothetical protein